MMTDPCEKIYMNKFQRRARIQRQSSGYRSSPFTKLGWEFKGTVSRDFLLLVFSWISFPQPQSIPLKPFRFFSKIRWDIRNSRCTTGINDTGVKVVKQWERLSNCWQLKMKSKKNYLYTYSTTQRCPKEIIKNFLIEDIFHLPWAANISANFRKNSKRR